MTIRNHRRSIAALTAASGLAIILSLLFGGAVKAQAEEPDKAGRGKKMRILFIGNSLTYANDLPLIVEAMARSAGHDPQVESVTFGGFSLQDQWNNGTALREISSQKWDVVVLQHGPSTLPESREETRHWAKKFAPRIAKAGARPAMYMVWPSLDRQSFFDAVRDTYSLAASDINGIFIPAGEAFREAWRRDPDAPLYSSDDFHPSAIGSYTAALSIYGMIYGRDPLKIPARLRLSNGMEIKVPPALATMLQEAATEANKTYGRR